MPHFILLDLNMPRMNGTEAIQEIRNDPSLKHIPVVFTTSNDTEDVMCCYRLGANSFIVKPASYEDLVSMLARLMAYWEGTVALPPECKSRLGRISREVRHPLLSQGVGVDARKE